MVYASNAWLKSNTPFPGSGMLQTGVTQAQAHVSNPSDIPAPVRSSSRFPGYCVNWIKKRDATEINTVWNQGNYGT